MQQEAVTTIDGPLLLLAGAGSGKTRVLVNRIAYMVQNGINPFNILAITFTNKAAREMKERLAHLLSSEGGTVWASTFHSMCVRILRRDIDSLGYNKNFTIYDSDDSLRLMRTIIKEQNINDKLFPPKSILGYIGEKKDRLVTPVQAVRSAEEAGEIFGIQQANLYTAYQKRLRTANALDFDDLIFCTVQLFEQFPAVLDRYRNRFRYISVDEYQDTNFSQYRLVKLLAEGYGNICVVGDDDQSIYGWRGADIRNILEFEKDFLGAKVIKLEQNYRSTKTILDAANAVIKKNIGRKGKNLWTENESGTAITLSATATDIDEAHSVVSHIKSQTAKGKNFGDFAILYRMNSLSRLFEERLVRENIPYKVVGGVRFYERKEVKDVLAYLKAIVNPLDDISMRRILNVPRRGIGDETEDRLAAYASEMEVSFYDALQSTAEIPGLPYNGKRVAAFAQLMDEFASYSDGATASTVLREVLEKTDFINDLMVSEKDKDIAKERIANVTEIITKAEEFEKNAAKEGMFPDLASFLEEVALVADIDALDGEGQDVVILMTVHSSKGLEFDTVFLIGFEQNIFPTSRAVYDTDRTKLEEERRLCYVAITRAMKSLFVSHAHSRRMFNETQYNPPSQFLKEIPEELLNVGTGTKSERTSPKISVSKAFTPGTIIPGTIMPKPTVNIPTSKEPPNYTVGDNIRQKKYGIGRVVSIKPAGADYEVTVEFPDVGSKKFMAILSKLEKVE